MIKYVFGSEFDIFQGCVIRESYPELQNYDEFKLSSYMIPDGVHKYETDMTFFKYKLLNLEL